MIDKKGAPKLVKGDEHKINEPQCAPFFPKKIGQTFPQRAKKKEENVKLKKFLDKLRNLSLKIPLPEAIQEIIGYTNIIRTSITR